MYVHHMAEVTTKRDQRCLRMVALHSNTWLGCSISTADCCASLLGFIMTPRGICVRNIPIYTSTAHLVKLCCFNCKRTYCATMYIRKIQIVYSVSAIAQRQIQQEVNHKVLMCTDEITSCFYASLEKVGKGHKPIIISVISSLLSLQVTHRKI